MDNTMDESKKEDIANLEEAIKKRKLRWKPKETPLSKMDKEKRKNMLGALLEKEDEERILKKMEEKKEKKNLALRAGGPVDPPSEWDWRDVSGVNWMTPIKDQRNCGSCVAFSVVGVLEMMIKRWAYNNSSVNPDYSEAHLYFCNNRRCTKAEGNYGWWVDQALDVLKKEGVSDEACMPYTAPPTQSCNVCPEWPYDIVLTKIKDWKYITDINEMKNILSEHGCMSAVMAVYTDFFYYGSNVYEVSWAPWVKFEGLHAITVIGYSDVDECWICKNSWNTTWGDQGYFRIAYGECGIDDGMYKMDIICPAESSATAMGITRETIQTVRNFRDRLLVTQKGRAYIYRALKNIGSVTNTLNEIVKDPELAKEASTALKPFVKAIQTMDTRRAYKPKDEDYKAAIVVLDKLAHKNKNLKPAVERIKEEIPRYRGKNLRQIMREL